MKDAENINFKVISVGSSERKPCNLDILTLKKLCEWIDQQELDPELAVEVKKAAGRYPHHALSKFKGNFTSQVAKIRRKLKIKTEAETPIEEL